GIGKTSLAVVEALAMATGLPLLGHQPPGPLRVFLWNGEEPVEELGRRMAAAMKHFGISPEMVGDRLFIDNGHTMPLILAEEGRDGTRVHAPLIHELIGELRRREVDVFLVDPVISTHNLSENENNGIQKLATAWKAVAVGANVAVGLAHHTRKLGGRDATTEDSRGADALIAKVRDGRVLNVMSEADAAKLGVLGRDRLSYFWTGGPGGKSNMSARTGQKEWFRLVSIDLGNGGAGGPGDSVGVVTSWRAPNVADDIEPERLVKLGAVMGERAWRAAPQAAKAPDWIGAAVATAFDLRGAEGWERKAKALVAELERRGVITLRTVVGPKRRSMPIFVFTGVSGDEGAG
ncbi:MAG: AAA family ATPase, partial [Tabrizicola sp.]|nr:AAA family ATPase [Tabrizicola sp.]